MKVKQTATGIAIVFLLGLSPIALSNAFATQTAQTSNWVMRSHGETHNGEDSKGRHAETYKNSDASDRSHDDGMQEHDEDHDEGESDYRSERLSTLEQSDAVQDPNNWHRG